MMDTMVRADAGGMNERRIRDDRGGDMQSRGSEIREEDIAMAKRSRHRLPSGFGTVRFLGKGRRRPFAVHPPAVAAEIEEKLTNTVSTGKWAAGAADFGERQAGVADFEKRQTEAAVSREIQVETEGGERLPASADVISETAVRGAVVQEKSLLSSRLCDPVPSGGRSGDAVSRSSEVRRHRIWKRPPAICYVTSRETGRKILQLYHAGEYRKGMEKEIERQEARGQAREKKTAAKDQAGEQQVSMAKGMVAEKAALPTEICEATSSKKNLQAGPGKAEAGIGLAMAEAGNEAAKGEAGIGLAMAEAGNEAAKGEAGTGIGMDEAGIGAAKAETGAGTAKGKAGTGVAKAEAGTEVVKDTVTEKFAIDAKAQAGSFARVYEAFFEYRYGEHAGKKLSKSTRNAMNAAYKKFARLQDVPMDHITVDDLQDIVNDAADAGYSRSAVRQMVTLAHQLYKYAYPRELCRKNCGLYVEMPGCAAAEEHHQDFTDEELGILWKTYRETGDPIVGMILVMCYSGFRIGEFADSAFRVCLSAQSESEEQNPAYFQGGLKTEAGRNRIVPIHSAILPLVMEMMGTDGKPVFFCGRTSGWFRRKMKEKMEELEIDTPVQGGAARSDGRIPGEGSIPDTSDAGEAFRSHTPHSTRHTFSRLCETYGVKDADRRRLLGHSFGSDITNGVYGHRSVSELRMQIEKILVPEPG